MEKIKGNILIIVILIQCIIAINLLIFLKIKSSKVLGVSISKIDVNTINRKASPNLPHYFEPKENSNIEVDSDWVPKGTVYTINSDTLNERFEYKISKHKDVYRIIILGDSLTFGQYVPTNSNWTELLEDYLNNEKTCTYIKKYEVINLGVMGYDTEFEIERYRLRGIKYKPDLVVWAIYDLYRFQEEAMALEEKLSYMEPESLNKMKNKIRHEGEKSDVSILEVARNEIIKSKGLGNIIAAQNKYFDLFRSMYQGKLLFIEIGQHPKKVLSEIFDHRLNEKTFFQKYEFSTDDTYPDTHFNLQGNRNMSIKVFDSLKRLKLLPCDKLSI